MAADAEHREWLCIGVIAQDTSGKILIRIASQDQLVRRTPNLQSIEKRYNEEFEEGEVRYYLRNPDEMSSHIEILKTSDPQFLSKYRDELAAQNQLVYLLNIRERQDSRPLEAQMDELLNEVYD